MHFTFISSMPGAPWGGSEELWSQAALRLKKDGHKVTASAVGWRTLSPRIHQLAEQGIKLSMQPRIDVSLIGKAWQMLRYSRKVNRPVFEKILREKPDLIIISQGGNLDGWQWMKWCREAGLPYVSIVHSNFEEWWPSDDISQDVRAAYLSARKVFCISRGNLSLLETQIGEALSNSEVIWNPVSVAKIEPSPWPSQKENWKLACVGRLQPSAKGQDLLFQVLAQSKWRERPIELNLYGQGSWENNLKQLSSHLQLSNVHFRGHVSNVTDVWKENHLLVLPSRYEGLPLTLVEAMWCGRPAVITNVGGNAEMCIDGETGFIAEAPTVQLLERALERAWSQRDTWAAIGQAARMLAQKRVPKDPVGDFCEKLISSADSAETNVSITRRHE